MRLVCLERCRDHGVDAVSEPIRRAVPSARHRVALGHDLRLGVVVQDELKLGKHVEQTIPIPVRDVAVQVVLGPHLPGDRLSVLPQLWTLRVANDLHAHSTFPPPPRRAAEPFQGSGAVSLDDTDGLQRASATRSTITGGRPRSSHKGSLAGTAASETR
jgi:hypothetical protein